VESISIHKGPHGTQFGAPGPLGVFDVTTRRPGPETEGEFSYTYGSHELHRGIIHTSGAILPNLFLGIDGLYARDEGWYEDELTGDAYGKHETTSGRIKLVWEATDQLEFTLTAGADHHDDDPVVYLPFTTDALYQVHADPDASATGRQGYQALRAVWKQDDWQVKSITSHRSSDFEDEDNALLVEVFFPGSSVRERDQEVTAWTQEIQPACGVALAHRTVFLPEGIRPRSLHPRHRPLGGRQ
jgi:outer membrane receptor protein involved in Fe transport